MLVRKLIRVDGTSVDLPARQSMDQIRALIGAQTLDTVTMRHMGHPRHVMIVDDTGWETEVIETANGITLKPTRARKPINAEATRLYLLQCGPGTTHQIVGDVVVVPDEDFA